MVEYTIVCALLAVALFAPVPGQQMSVAQMLADALRKFYSALSFFLSIP
jgi:Flp pilus assembly pilin Flp